MGRLARPGVFSAVSPKLMDEPFGQDPTAEIDLVHAASNGTRNQRHDEHGIRRPNLKRAPKYRGYEDSTRARAS